MAIVTSMLFLKHKSFKDAHLTKEDKEQIKKTVSPQLKKEPYIEPESKISIGESVPFDLEMLE